MSTHGSPFRKRHQDYVATRDTHGSLGFNPAAPTMPGYGADMDVEQVQTERLGPAAVTEERLATGAATASKISIAGLAPGSILADCAFDWLGQGDTRYWSVTAGNWSAQAVNVSSTYVRGRYRMRLPAPAGDGPHSFTSQQKVKIANRSVYTLALLHSIEGQTAGTAKVEIDEYNSTDTFLRTSTVMAWDTPGTVNYPGAQSAVIAGSLWAKPAESPDPAVTLDTTTQYFIVRVIADASFAATNWYVTLLVVNEGETATLDSSPTNLFGGVHIDAGGVIVYDGKIQTRDAAGNVTISDGVVQADGLEIGMRDSALAGFTDPFDDPVSVSQWVNYGGTGVRSIATVSDAQTGSAVLRVAGGQAWLIHPRNIPYDPKALYRITVRVRQVSGASNTQVYAGVAGVAADGTTFVNRDGNDLYSSQHYLAVSGTSLTAGAGWQDFVGYFSGTAATGDATAHPESSAPGALHQNVRYFRPLVLVNYTGGTGTAEVDVYSVQRIDATGVANLGGNVKIDSTGIAITDGALTLSDSDGTTVMSGGGFAGPWLSFIHDGIYNSGISTAVAGAVPDGLTSVLPHWTVSRTTLTSLTAVSSTSWPGGKYVEAVPSALSGFARFNADPVPVTPLLPYTVGCWVSFTQGGSAWQATFGYITWKTAAMATIGTEVFYFLGYHKATDASPRVMIGQPAVAPANAAYAVVSFKVREDNAHSASSRLRWGGGFFHPSDSLGSGASIWGIGAGPYLPWSATTTLNANQANIYPVQVLTPTWIGGCEIAFANTSLARSWEWGLYYDASDGTDVVRRWPGLKGSASFTPSAIGHSISIADEPCNVPPGVYYLIIRNTQGTNNLILAAEANHLVAGGYMSTQAITGVKTSAGALGSTFDMSTLTSTGPTMAAVWLFAQNVSVAWGYGT